MAGAFAENLPLVVITGGPNSNDIGRNQLIHHTIGKRFDFLQASPLARNSQAAKVDCRDSELIPPRDFGGLLHCRR